DKLSVQGNDTEVRTPLRDAMEKSGSGYDDLEAVFNKLEELAQSPWMSRTIRKLDVPANVEVKFRGEETSTSDTYKRLEGNQYNVPLEGLQGSTKFKSRARGDNFFTPPKTVSLVPAPTPASVTTDTEEPAYLYHRLPFQRYEVDDPNVPGKKQDVIVD